MGKAHSGKTSMRSIIFANYLARDTTRLSPTLDVEHHHVRFLGDLVLNLWDCGGQDAFFESYFERDRETIFRSVELLIYVFDIESETPEKDFEHFTGVLTAIEENSPDARVFCLIHKMDLVAEEDRVAILQDRQGLIRDSCHARGVTHFQCFGTSIWDETLYKAWSEIVTNLIPNLSLLERHLQNFTRICDADEVVLFERATFLVIAHAQSDLNDNYPAAEEEVETQEHGDNRQKSIQGNGAEAGPMIETEDDTNITNPGYQDAAIENTNSIVEDSNLAASKGTSSDTLLLSNTESGHVVQQQPQPHVSQDAGESETALQQQSRNSSRHVQRTHHFDAHRFEKISNIVKQFKLSCGKAQSQFQGMSVGNSRFTAILDAFTAHTYIMVIVSNPAVAPAATLLNINAARNHFESFIPRV